MDASNPIMQIYSVGLTITAFIYWGVSMFSRDAPKNGVDNIVYGLLIGAVWPLFLVVLLFAGVWALAKKPPPRPVQKVSQLADFPPNLAACLKTPAAPLPPSSAGTVSRWTPEMVALLREAAALNGGFVDSALLDKLGREPTFSTVTSRGIAAKARSIGIRYQKAQGVE